MDVGAQVENLQPRSKRYLVHKTRYLVHNNDVWLLDAGSQVFSGS